MKLSNKMMAIMILLMAITLASCSEDDKKDEKEVVLNEMTATINIATSSSTVTETVDFDASDNIAFADGMISGTSASYTIAINTSDNAVTLSDESSTVNLAEGTSVAGSGEDEHEYTGSFTFSSEGESTTITCTNGAYTLEK